MVYCWVYPLFTMVYSWDLVPWWVNPGGFPHLHADQGWSVAPGTHEGRPTCHECQPQWCSLPQRNVASVEMTGIRRMNFVQNSEDLGISWIVTSVSHQCQSPMLQVSRFLCPGTQSKVDLPAEVLSPARAGATLTPRLGSAFLFDTTSWHILLHSWATLRNTSKSNICSDLHPTSSDFHHLWTKNFQLVSLAMFGMFGPDPKCHRCTPPISSSPNDIDRRRAQRPHSRWRKPGSPQRPGRDPLAIEILAWTSRRIHVYILYI